MFGSVGNSFLIVRVEHRGLDIGVPEHVLDLVQRGASLEGDRGRRMPDGVGSNASDILRLADRLVEQSRLSHIVPHHILNHPHANRPTATRDGRIVLA